MNTRLGKAFTLAEVLITLAIIGVVAALTIPNLVQSYKKKVVETKLLKFYVNMQNAVKLSEIENGDKKNWTIQNNGSVEEFYLKYFAPYLKTLKYEVIDNMVYVYFADGTIFRMYANGDTTVAAQGALLINGKAVNNEYAGKNSFNFYWGPAQTELSGFCENPILNSYNNGWVPYLYWEQRHYDDERGCSQIDVPEDKEEFRNILINQKNYGCKHQEGLHNGAYCTALIEMNGWKIPDDYPIKF